jgi:hypothetical protein
VVDWTGEEDEERNGGDYKGSAFLGKEVEKGLEASGQDGRGLDSSRTTALGFVLVAAPWMVLRFLGEGDGEVAGTWKVLESTRGS